MSTLRRLEVVSCSEVETERVAESLGGLLPPGTTVALFGTLASGKTRFVKGLAKGLGLRSARKSVVSPTFTLIHEFSGLYHIDAFRLRGASDLEALGAAELFDSDAIVALEWAENVIGGLPESRLDVRMEHLDKGSRLIILKERGGLTGVLVRLKKILAGLKMKPPDR